jgi:hypothetical protein
MADNIRKKDEYLLVATDGVDLQINSTSKFDYEVPAGRKAKVTISITEEDV